MKKVPSDVALGEAVDLGEVFDFLVKIIQLEDGFNRFTLTPHEHTLIHQVLLQECSTHPRTPSDPYHLKALVIQGVILAKKTASYQYLKKQYQQTVTIKSLQESGTPVSQFPQLAQTKAKQLNPADCAALQDWPTGRLPANGSDGRLENAGQFMQRLLDQKIYDEAVYGKLYLHDLRTINSKFYIALAQWQNRTGTQLLAKKADEMAALEQQAQNSPEQLSFSEKTRVSNARWRRRQHASS